ncbi:metal-dependent hydrolase [Thalassoporum mexicanum]|uniref:metal-dependent hydrolase n=1 Tax=Thalassoporum mexicanum TaxID=3457544 RepID=UPI0030D770BB
MPTQSLHQRSPPMNTPSHFLINATIGKKFLPTANLNAILWGSIAPDIALYILSIGGYVYYHLIQGWEIGVTFNYMFDQLFFQHPFWIISHNLLHSPLLLTLGLVYFWRDRHRVNTRRGWCFWFFSSCMIHTILDIFTHVDDGPLLLFPIDWQLRFQSAISYWDHRYFGRQFAIAELILDLFLIAILVYPWLMRKVQRLQRKLAAQPVSTKNNRK